VQDEIHAAGGSLNRYEFRGDKFAVCPVCLFAPRLNAINWSLYLVRHDVRR